MEGMLPLNVEPEDPHPITAFIQMLYDGLDRMDKRGQAQQRRYDEMRALGLDRWGRNDQGDLIADPWASMPAAAPARGMLDGSLPTLKASPPRRRAPIPPHGGVRG